jgi:hypothetical protein
MKSAVAYKVDILKSIKAGLCTGFFIIKNHKWNTETSAVEILTALFITDCLYSESNKSLSDNGS